MYVDGQGVVQDYGEAKKWYNKAADQGFVEAQCNLGIMYAIGQGIDQDEKKAIIWYNKAGSSD